ncbi:hypothetical protein MRBBS_2933 [Marinobacter sp. BSs20148]|nr:hypothetical protein MRBBS_2933 [Marinobacter sp. BSs20148]
MPGRQTTSSWLSVFIAALLLFEHTGQKSKNMKITLSRFQ